MRFFLISEGVIAVFASVASYLWGYLDGRANVRAIFRNALEELREAE